MGSARTAETLTDENGDVKIHATIDGHSLSITEDHNFQQHTSIYSVPSLTMKVFSNMKRFTKGFSGQEVALFPTMLDANEPSPSPYRITSSPSPTPSPSPAQSLSQPSPTQPSPTQPSPTQPGTENHPSHTPMTHSPCCTLTKEVRMLESQVKIGKARKQTRVVISDDEAFEDDSSKTRRKLFNEEVQEKASTETELFIQEVTPTEVIQDQEGSGKSSDEVSTAGFEESLHEKKVSPEKIGVAKVITQEEKEEDVKNLETKRKKSIPRKQHKEVDKRRRQIQRKKTQRIFRHHTKKIHEVRNSTDLVKERYRVFKSRRMENGRPYNMLTKKKYPLKQEMISKDVEERLEVDHESTQAIELLRFYKISSSEVTELFFLKESSAEEEY
ncbi:hypothetical protein Tco_0851097 [Tanacetum coccineum]